MTPEIEALAYPIGRFEAPSNYDAAQIFKWIDRIEFSPQWFDAVIENLDEAQLQMPYRPGGWTIHQVIHHVADSHMNAFIRFKLALTEVEPVIKPYAEAAWADTADVTDVPVNVSITLIHSLHRRWALLLRSLQPADWKRTFFHPEQQRAIPLWESLAQYAWHTRHYFEQVFRLKERMNWL